jgi:hypothetical protein
MSSQIYSWVDGNHWVHLDLLTITKCWTLFQALISSVISTTLGHKSSLYAHFTDEEMEVQSFPRPSANKDWPVFNPGSLALKFVC